MIVEATPEDHAGLLLSRAPRAYHTPDTPIAPVDVLGMLAGIAAQVRETFSPASWLIVEGEEVVGLCSIKSPPRAGVIDIGYGIAPSRQNRGIAGRAIGELVAWARNAPEVTAVMAETGIANLPSQRVLARNGFSRVGERLDDEDGLLICWRCSAG